VHDEDTAPREGLLLSGRWRLDRFIGAGGAGVVYHAIDTKENAAVAVKILHRNLAEDEVMRERFVREAKIANIIKHPGVVAVLGDGVTEDGAPFLVMELLEGETLEARWTRKGQILPPREVLWIADELLDVLHAAHDKKIVHRDIKPENLFLTNDRRLKVLDFGIARFSEASEAVTRVGSVLGTLDFMAPEQARGDVDQVGVHTDLFGVGATMFALLSGKTVHPGDTLNELLSAATKRPPPTLASVAPDVPTGVVELVDLALSFDIPRRWKSARLMQMAVREVASQLKAKSENMKAAPGDEESPFSVTPLEMPRKLDSVEPPPMSRAFEPQLVSEPAPPPPPPEVPTVVVRESAMAPEPKDRRMIVAFGIVVLALIVVLLLLKR
jgi:serine/threonine-protein kinase